MFTRKINNLSTMF